MWLIASLQLALENFARLPDQPCVSQQTIEALCQRIAQLRRDDPQCYIIVSLHWGWENHVEVVARQRYEARQLIDAGADCLVCHHTHTLQPSETYQGKPIFYSIGNFIFDPRNDLNRHGAMVRLTITEQGATVEEHCRGTAHCHQTMHTLSYEISSEGLTPNSSLKHFAK